MKKKTEPGFGFMLARMVTLIGLSIVESVIEQHHGIIILCEDTNL